MADYIFSPHWISTHRGTLGSTPDRDVFARWHPALLKTITVDEKVPYLEDIPPYSKIVVRNHPMSELNDNRGSLGRAMQDAGLVGDPLWR